MTRKEARVTCTTSSKGARVFKEVMRDEIFISFTQTVSLETALDARLLHVEGGEVTIRS